MFPRNTKKLECRIDGEPFYFRGYFALSGYGLTEIPLKTCKLGQKIGKTKFLFVCDQGLRERRQRRFRWDLIEDLLAFVKTQDRTAGRIDCLKFFLP
jgi:hypothetical protein